MSEVVRLSEETRDAVLREVAPALVAMQKAKGDGKGIEAEMLLWAKVDGQDCAFRLSVELMK